MKHKHVIKNLSLTVSLTVSLAVSLTLLLFSLSSNAQQAITFGHAESLHSKILNEDRKLWIKLPEGYQENTDLTYPVLYTLDGETHFKRVAGMLEWLSDTSQTIPQHIVVAVHNNGQQSRRRDTDVMLKDGIIPAQAHLRFLTDELIPHIDKTYRTAPHKTLAAHSAQGLFALYAFSQTKSPFNAFISMSPFLSDQTTAFTAELVKKISENETSGSFLFMTLGDEPRLTSNVDILHKGLIKHSKSYSAWEYQYYPQETHMSVPSKTLHNAMLAIAVDQGWTIPTSVTIKGANAIIEYYNKISKKLGTEVQPKANLFIGLGWDAFVAKRYVHGEALIKSALNLYPKNSSLYFVLAHLYESAEQLKKAEKSALMAVKMGKQNNETNALVGYENTLQRIQEKI